MQPEPDKIDLSSLDTDVERGVARVLALRRFRRVVTTRGVTAALLVAAAAALLWLSAPRRPRAQVDALSWAVPGAQPEEILKLGGSYAQ